MSLQNPSVETLHCNVSQVLTTSSSWPPTEMTLFKKKYRVESIRKRELDLSMPQSSSRRKVLRRSNATSLRQYPLYFIEKFPVRDLSRGMAW